MAGIEQVLTNFVTFLETIAPLISIILIILAGIVWGLSQAQPADSRGKWINAAIGLLVGGIIIMAIVGAATLIRDTSLTLLT